MDPKKVYNKFNGKTGSSNGDILNAEESRTFWSGISSVEKKHKEAKWLSDLKKEMVKLEQQNAVINECKVKKECSKMPNCLSSAYGEITYRYYFRGYVLFHGKRKLTATAAKWPLEEK